MMHMICSSPELANAANAIEIAPSQTGVVLYVSNMPRLELYKPRASPNLELHEFRAPQTSSEKHRTQQNLELTSFELLGPRAT